MGSDAQLVSTEANANEASGLTAALCKNFRAVEVLNFLMVH